MQQGFYITANPVPFIILAIYIAIATFSLAFANYRTILQKYQVWGGIGFASPSFNILIMQVCFWIGFCADVMLIMNIAIGRPQYSFAGYSRYLYFFHFYGFWYRVAIICLVFCTLAYFFALVVPLLRFITNEMEKDEELARKKDKEQKERKAKTKLKKRGAERDQVSS